MSVSDAERLLTPVSEADPCGADLRWDPEVSTLETTLAQLFRPSEQGAIEAQAAESEGEPRAQDLVAATEKISEKTKSIAVLSVRARARWLEEGLAGFADTMEALAAALERWPDAKGGIHPREDSDGDLAERYAALARALGAIAPYADQIGWGKTRERAQQAHTARRLTKVFAGWEARTAPATAGDAPSARDAWKALEAIDGFEGLEAEGAETAPEAGADGEHAPVEAGRGSDPWGLLEQTIHAMERANAHSPGLLLLRLVHSWKEAEIAGIVEGMAASGVGLESLVKAAKQQIDPRRQG